MWSGIGQFGFSANGARGARGARPERPSKILGQQKTCPDWAGHVESFGTQDLRVAFLLTDEGFQKALCSQVGLPSSSEANVLSL